LGEKSIEAQTLYYYNLYSRWALQLTSQVWWIQLVKTEQTTTVELIILLVLQDVEGEQCWEDACDTKGCNRLYPVAMDT